MSKDKFARQPKITQRLKGRARLLDSWGGRHESDVGRDEIGEFVLMANGFGDMTKVYLSKDL